MCTPVSSCSVNRAVSVACQKRTLLKHEEDCDERFRPKNNADHVICFLIIIMPPTVGKRTISVAFVCPSVCPSVTYIANNSRTKRPSVPKFGLKVPHLRCDSHTSFKVRRSKVRVTDGRGIPCRPNPAATLLVIYAEI